MTKPCHENPDHSSQVRRLNRIEGQISGIRKMIEERRYCPDILVQTKAATSAIRALEAEILKEHMEHCVQVAFESGSEAERAAKIEEIINLFKKDK
ncbi:MAG: metal-sensitive transcriptional regulator [Sphingomonadales bacterium]|nr:metal-sensitive transcriptional regulator [Sphingomonadales bacterium]